MGLVICTAPGCQTSAGCRCNDMGKPVYLDPARAWAHRAVDHGAEIERLNKIIHEMEALREAVSEQRATVAIEAYRKYDERR